MDHLFGYTGREWDSDIGLQYNRARWYDPKQGRWISQDPIGFAAGDENLYRYVGNGPTNATDPSGLEKELIGWVYEISTPNGTGWFVQYIGKADNLEQRFANKNHPAAHLLIDKSNRIRVKPIFADLDPNATSRGTMRAAKDHAQKSIEQRTIGRNLPPLNRINAATEANRLQWEMEQKASSGRFRQYSQRKGFIAIPSRPSLSTMSRGLSMIGRTAGMGLVGIAEVASMADAINAPTQIEDYGGYLKQSPSHFVYQELFANAYMMSWHASHQLDTERNQQPFIDSYLSAPNFLNPTLELRPTSIGIMREDLAQRSRAFIDAQLHYRVMISGNDLLESQYAHWSMDKKVEIYKKSVCP